MDPNLENMSCNLLIEEHAQNIGLIILSYCKSPNVTGDRLITTKKSHLISSKEKDRRAPHWQVQPDPAHFLLQRPITQWTASLMTTQWNRVCPTQH